MTDFCTLGRPTLLINCRDALLYWIIVLLKFFNLASRSQSSHSEKPCVNLPTTNRLLSPASPILHQLQFLLLLHSTLLVCFHFLRPPYDRGTSWRPCASRLCTSIDFHPPLYLLRISQLTPNSLPPYDPSTMVLDLESVGDQSRTCYNLVFNTMAKC